MSNVVLVDTDVWSILYSRNSDPRRGPWEQALVGKTIAIAIQTRAEVFAGMFLSSWGESRTSTVRRQLDVTATIAVDEPVVQAFARLGAEARRAGHPLQEKVHSGDRWVAATAIALDLPLFAGDKIYRGCPGLRTVDETPR